MTLNVPTTRDLRRLQSQLDDLNSKIGALLEEQQRGEADDTPSAPSGTPEDRQ